jgi:hypothetical protein
VGAWILGGSRSSIPRLDVREHGRTAAVEEHLLELRHVLSFVEAPENVEIGEMPALELDLAHGDRHTPNLLKKLWDPADTRQLADFTGVGVFRRVLQAIHFRLLWWRWELRVCGRHRVDLRGCLPHGLKRRIKQRDQSSPRPPSPRQSQMGHQRRRGPRTSCACVPWRKMGTEGGENSFDHYEFKFLCV